MQEGVGRVVYPGRADHPDAESGVVGRVMPGPAGAMLTLVLDGGDERALRVLRGLSVAVEATSLGGVETLASTPFNSSHFNLTPQERLDAGILPGTLRLAIGLEGAEVLAADLRQALERTEEASGSGAASSGLTSEARREDGASERREASGRGTQLRCAPISSAAGSP